MKQSGRYMAETKHGEQAGDALPFVLFRSLRPGDEICATDEVNLYMFRVRTGGIKPIAEFWWQPRQVNGEPEAWRLACSDAELCGHCGDFEAFVYVNELDQAVAAHVPLDPVVEEFAQGRRAWVGYPRLRIGSYDVFISGPLLFLDVYRPDKEPTIAGS